MQVIRPLFVRGFKSLLPEVGVSKDQNGTFNA